AAILSGSAHELAGANSDRGSYWIAMERPHLANGYPVFVGADKGRHDFGFADHGGKGIATANDLADSRQIRDHPVILLRTTVGKSEARHHFVENQGNPVARSYLTQPLQEAGHGR